MRAFGSLGDLRRPPSRFREFLAHNQLEARIASRLASLDVDDVGALATAGAEIRGWVVSGTLPPALRDAIAESYRATRPTRPTRSWAVRSSATAEDLPEASFAGQQETFLNIKGLENILHAIKEVFASLYNDRAIAYRVHQGFAHEHVALSAGVQRMVRSDLGAAGVMFTLDTESGFDQVVFITVVLRARRDGRAGRGQSGRVLRLQAQPRRGAAGDPAQSRRRARRCE